MSHHDSLPTPEAERYSGVTYSTLRRKLTPVGSVKSGRRGRPMCLWFVRDLDEIRVQRQGGADHA